MQGYLSIDKAGRTLVYCVLIDNNKAKQNNNEARFVSASTSEGPSSKKVVFAYAASPDQIDSSSAVSFVVQKFMITGKSSFSLFFINDNGTKSSFNLFCNDGDEALQWVKALVVANVPQKFSNVNTTASERIILEEALTKESTKQSHTHTIPVLDSSFGADQGRSSVAKNDDASNATFTKENLNIPIGATHTYNNATKETGVDDNDDDHHQLVILDSPDARSRKELNDDAPQEEEEENQESIPILVSDSSAPNNPTHASPSKRFELRKQGSAHSTKFSESDLNEPRQTLENFIPPSLQTNNNPNIKDTSKKRRYIFIAIGFLFLLAVVIGLAVGLTHKPATQSPTGVPTTSPTPKPTLAPTTIEQCIITEDLLPFNMSQLTPVMRISTLLQEPCMIYQGFDRCFIKGSTPPYEYSDMVLDSGSWFFNDIVTVSYNHSKDRDGNDALFIRYQIQFAHDKQRSKRAFVYNAKVSPRIGCILALSKYELHLYESGESSGRRRCTNETTPHFHETVFTQLMSNFPFFSFFNGENWMVLTPEYSGLYTADPNVTNNSPYAFLVGVYDTRPIYRLSSLKPNSTSSQLKQILDEDAMLDPFDKSYCIESQNFTRSGNDTEFLSDPDYYFPELIPRDLLEIDSNENSTINEKVDDCSRNCSKSVNNTVTILHDLEICFQLCFNISSTSTKPATTTKRQLATATSPAWNCLTDVSPTEPIPVGTVVEDFPEAAPTIPIDVKALKYLVSKKEKDWLEPKAKTFNKFGKKIIEGADKLGIDRSLYAAVLSVESSGRAYDPATKLTVIKFELHQFIPRVKAKSIQDCETAKKYFRCEISGVAIDLCTQKCPAESKNAPTAIHKYRESESSTWKDTTSPYQSEVWKVFKIAASINRNAAIQATSFGMGQVMGFNWEIAGYDSPEHMYCDMTTSIKGQFSAFESFLKKSKFEGKSCLDWMKEKNYVNVAKAYNGANMKLYDIKIIRAEGNWTMLFNTIQNKCLVENMIGANDQTETSCIATNGTPYQISPSKIGMFDERTGTFYYSTDPKASTSTRTCCVPKVSCKDSLGNIGSCIIDNQGYVCSVPLKPKLCPGSSRVQCCFGSVIMPKPTSSPVQNTTPKPTTTNQLTSSPTSQLGTRCNSGNEKPVPNRGEYWPRNDFDQLIDSKICNIDTNFIYRLSQLQQLNRPMLPDARNLLGTLDGSQLTVNGRILGIDDSFVGLLKSIDDVFKRIEYSIADIYDITIDGSIIVGIIGGIVDEFNNALMVLKICSLVPFTAPFCSPSYNVVFGIQQTGKAWVSAINNMINPNAFADAVNPTLTFIYDFRYEVVKVKRTAQQYITPIIKYGGFTSVINTASKQLFELLSALNKVLQTILAFPIGFVNLVLDKIQVALDLVRNAKKPIQAVRKVANDINNFWSPLRKVLGVFNSFLETKISVGQIAAKVRDGIKRGCMDALAVPCKYGCKVVDVVVEAVGVVIEGAKVVAQAAAKAAEEAYEVAKKAFDALTEVGKKAIEAAKEALDTAVKALEKAGKIIINVITGAVEYVANVASSAWNGITSFFGGLFGRQRLRRRTDTYEIGDEKYHPYIAGAMRRLSVCTDVCDKAAEFTCEASSEILVPRLLQLVPDISIKDILQGIAKVTSAIGIDAIIEALAKTFFNDILFPKLLDFVSSELKLPRFDTIIQDELKRLVGNIKYPQAIVCYMESKSDLNRMWNCPPFLGMKQKIDSMFNKQVGEECEFFFMCNPSNVMSCLKRCCSDKKNIPLLCSECDESGSCSACIDGMYLTDNNECMPKLIDGLSCTSSKQCLNGECKDGTCCGEKCGWCDNNHFSRNLICLPKIKAGLPCTARDECLSGSCINGICCKEDTPFCGNCLAATGDCSVCTNSDYRLISGSCSKKLLPGSQCLSTNGLVVPELCDSGKCLNKYCCNSEKLLTDNCISCSSIGECNTCDKGYFIEKIEGCWQDRYPFNKLERRESCPESTSKCLNLDSKFVRCLQNIDEYETYSDDPSHGRALVAIDDRNLETFSAGKIEKCKQSLCAQIADSVTYTSACLAQLKDGSECNRAEMCQSNLCGGKYCCSTLASPSNSCSQCNSLGTCESCVGDYFLQNKLCIKKYANGQSCSANMMCQSNSCIGGFCCSSTSASNCLSCNSNGQCSSCTTGYFLDSNGVCYSTKQGGMGCSSNAECDSKSCKGQKCCKTNDSACSNCVGIGGVCSSCNSGYYLLNGACNSKLLAGTQCSLDDQCTSSKCLSKCCSYSIPNCLECGSNGLCTKCTADKLLLNGVCGEKYGYGSLCSSDGDCASAKCKGRCCNNNGIPNECTSCTTNGDCQSCVSTHYVFNGKCVYKKTPGEACTSLTQCASGICKGVCCRGTDTSNNCYTCGTAGTCISCYSGYYPLAGICTLKKSNGQACDTDISCSSGKCKGVCCSGWGTDSKCLKCGATDCSICISGWKQCHGYCIAEADGCCASGYCENGGTCAANDKCCSAGNVPCGSTCMPVGKNCCGNGYCNGSCCPFNSCCPWG